MPRIVRYMLALAVGASVLAPAALASAAISPSSEHIDAVGALGYDSIGLVDPLTGEWHLQMQGSEILKFYFGNPGDEPFIGDWDCDGIDTPGLYRRSDGFVYLRNSNTFGIADIEFYFGDPGDVPLPGDFDGDGCDTVSIYRPSEARVYVINRLGAGSAGLGAADKSYYFGDFGDVPFVGDFDGDRVDTVGLHRATTGLVYYRNDHQSGIAHDQFVFGDPGDRIFMGDWSHDGADSVGLFRSSTARVYIQDDNEAGVADADWRFGESGFRPVAGVFGLPSASVDVPADVPVRINAGPVGVDVPVGALSAAGRVTIEPTFPPANDDPPPGSVRAGPVYEITVQGAEVQGEITIWFRPSEVLLARGTEFAIGYYDKAAGKWRTVPTTLDGSGLVMAVVDHLTSWAVFVESALELPLHSALTDVEVVARIPSIMRAQERPGEDKWEKAANLMEVWQGRAASVDRDRAAPVTDLVTIDWLRGFPRARRAYDGFVDDLANTELQWATPPGGGAYPITGLLLTPNVKRSIAHMLQDRGMLTDGSHTFGWSLPSENSKYDVLALNEVFVQQIGTAGSANIDGLTATLNAYNLRAAISGTVEKVSPTEFRVRVTEIGVYVVDKYDFAEDNYFGCWTPPDDISRGIFGCDGVKIYDQSFRNWREREKKGGDYCVFSDVRVTRIDVAVTVTLQDAADFEDEYDICALPFAQAPDVNFATGHIGMDLDAACRSQHAPDAVAHPADPDDPYSWVCRRDISGVDLHEHCVGRGFDGAVLRGNTAGDWRCVDSDGPVPGTEHAGMDLHAACRDRYGGRAYAHLVDSNDPFSWTCRTDLGGVDLHAHCVTRGYERAVLVGNTAGDWRCERTTVVGSTAEQTGMDLHAACRDRYGSGAYAHLVDSNDPFSWLCREELGGVDLHAHCTGRGYERAVLVGNTAGDWRCEKTVVVGSHTERTGIDVDAACRSQYHSAAYAYTSNSGDPHSWICRRNFGGVDLDNYCTFRGYDRAILIGSDAGAWRCERDVVVGSHTERTGMDLDLACREQYGSGATSAALDWNNPYSWRCFRNGVNLGGLNLDEYCVNRGYDRAVLLGSTAADWKCERTVVEYGVERTGIDVDRACRDTYGSAAYSYTDDWGDPHSWRCRRDYGGVDLSAHCQSVGYDRAVLVGNSAHDWRCERTVDDYGPEHAGIEVADACVEQHGAGASAYTESWLDPYSWNCRRDRGDLDLDAYCVSIGFDRSVLIGSSPYDWRCERTVDVYGPEQAGIEVADACVEQHGAGALAYTESWVDPYSWSCRRNDGGLALDVYCVSIGFDRSVLIGSSPYDWRCERDIITTGTVDHSIDVSQACVEQQGAGAYAHAAVWPDAYSWRCVRDEEGGLDLHTYCRLIGFDRAVLVANDAFGWRCERNLS